MRPVLIVHTPTPLFTPGKTDEARAGQSSHRVSLLPTAGPSRCLEACLVPFQPHGR
jgi:hypothetical protein